MTLSLSATCKAPRTARTTAQRPTLVMMFKVWKERRELAALDASRLRDLGISPVDAAREAARPVWDLPHYGPQHGRC